MNKRMFDELHLHRLEIDQAFGGGLAWERAESRLGSKIAYYVEAGGYADDEAVWSTVQESMMDAMVRLERALAPYLTSLKSVM